MSIVKKIKGRHSDFTQSCIRSSALHSLLRRALPLGKAKQIKVTCCRVAQRAMQGLTEAFETVLQFLELLHADQARLSEVPTWLLAATRAYGRQAPLSFAIVASSFLAADVC